MDSSDHELVQEYSPTPHSLESPIIEEPLLHSSGRPSYFDSKIEGDDEYQKFWSANYFNDDFGTPL